MRLKNFLRLLTLKPSTYTEGSKLWKDRIRWEGSMTSVLMERYGVDFIEASRMAREMYQKKYPEKCIDDADW